MWCIISGTSMMTEGWLQPWSIILLSAMVLLKCIQSCDRVDQTPNYALVVGSSMILPLKQGDTTYDSWSFSRDGSANQQRYIHKLKLTGKVRDGWSIDGDKLRKDSVQFQDAGTYRAEVSYAVGSKGNEEFLLNVIDLPSCTSGECTIKFSGLAPTLWTRAILDSQGRVTGEVREFDCNDAGPWGNVTWSILRCTYKQEPVCPRCECAIGWPSITRMYMGQTKLPQVFRFNCSTFDRKATPTAEKNATLGAAERSDATTSESSRCISECVSNNSIMPVLYVIASCAIVMAISSAIVAVHVIRIW